MLVDERREHILKSIESQGFVSLQTLAELVAASESTVRRDLEYLDSIGQIRRTRGGAAYVGESLTGFEERRLVALEQKQQIARVTADLIEPGETVLLDGGTTTLEVARQLIRKRLTIVTNSLPIVNLLMNQPEIELILIGGYLYPKTGVALGPHAVSCLKNLRVRRLIMSTGGITAEGLFNSNSLLVETERQMLEAAAETIVVADSRKIGHPELAPLCPLESVDRLVVDDQISPQWSETIRRAGVDLIVA